MKLIEGHPNEEWVREFLAKHEKNLQYYTPDALVRKVLDTLQKDGKLK